GEHLGHHHARFDPLHQEAAEIPVKRAQVVLFSKPEAGADDDRFLPDPRVHTASDLALADQNAEPLVERTNQLQPEEHVQQLLGRQLELRPLDWQRDDYMKSIELLRKLPPRIDGESTPSHRSSTCAYTDRKSMS